MTTIHVTNHSDPAASSPLPRPKTKHFLKYAAIACVALTAMTTAATIAPAAHAASGADVFVPELSAIPVNGSRPSAPKTIFLNFDGGALTKTSWNQATGMSVLPFKASGMSDAEKLETYQETVQAFSSFDVNVVATRPSEDDLVKTTPADSRYGVVVNISSNTEADPGFDKVYSAPSTTGVAVDNGFGSGYGNQVFISSTKVKNLTVTMVRGQKAYDGDPGHRIGNIAAHEIGHTLGLLHHGFTPSSSGQTEYYMPDEGLWGPIMGATGRVAFSRWSDGYPGDPNPGQDDMQLMTTEQSIKNATKYVGFDPSGMPVKSYCTSGDGTSYAPELIGGASRCTSAAKANPANAVSVQTYYSGKIGLVQTPESSNPLAPRQLDTSKASVSANGQLTTNGAPNYYSLRLGKGPASFDVMPIGPFSRLDLKISLLDANGGILAGPIDPPAQAVVKTMTIGNGTFDQQIPAEATGTGARIDFNVPADGSYILKVEQTSLGNMNANTDKETVAAPSYGDVGWYTIRGTITPLAAPVTPPTPPTSAPAVPVAPATPVPSAPASPVTLVAPATPVPSAPASPVTLVAPATPVPSAPASPVTLVAPATPVPSAPTSAPLRAQGSALAETGAGATSWWFGVGVLALFLGTCVVLTAVKRRPRRQALKP